MIQVSLRKVRKGKCLGHFIFVNYFELFDSTKQQLFSTSVTYGDAVSIISQKSTLDVIKSPIEKLVHSFAMLNKLSLT